MELKTLQALISAKLTHQIQMVIAEVVAEINTLGYDYQPADPALTTWVNSNQPEILKIQINNGAIAVNFMPEPTKPIDQLKSEIQDNGLWQFYKNQGLTGMASAIALFHKFGAVEPAIILTDAYELLASYETIRASLMTLDQEFAHLAQVSHRL